MFPWVGLCGDLHLTFLPRKPHPLGWMLKTAACAVVGVMIYMELAMCKELMRGMEFVAEHRPTCACTLRLVQNWFHSARIVVADSWFGSMKTATELMKRNLYSVLAIKTGSANYPKEELEKRVTEGGRFSFAAKTREVHIDANESVTMLAAGWMDKKDMLVLATCTDTNEAPPAERIRSKYKEGKIHKSRYTVVQRNCHAFYRQHFNTIDILNKLALGPGSVAAGWKPHNGIQDELKKFFNLHLLSLRPTPGGATPTSPATTSLGTTGSCLSLTSSLPKAAG